MDRFVVSQLFSGLLEVEAGAGQNQLLPVEEIIFRHLANYTVVMVVGSFGDQEVDYEFEFWVIPYCCYSCGQFQQLQVL